MRCRPTLSQPGGVSPSYRTQARRRHGAPHPRPPGEAAAPPGPPKEAESPSCDQGSPSPDPAVRRAPHGPARHRTPRPHPAPQHFFPARKSAADFDRPHVYKPTTATCLPAPQTFQVAPMRLAGCEREKDPPSTRPGTLPASSPGEGNRPAGGGRDSTSSPAPGPQEPTDAGALRRRAGEEAASYQTQVPSGGGVRAPRGVAHAHAPHAHATQPPRFPRPPVSPAPPSRRLTSVCARA
ncbi:proline-rich protein 2-like [Trichosurus vulpecula]|uniref:proline-rich protein 2-like n=1 Tax=Trichosurus vulpecula TaxID=9337 RepID=UPI00186AE169|nr:proline-rich protein 2-like [Trichosurus vulpecula]